MHVDLLAHRPMEVTLPGDTEDHMGLMWKAGTLVGVSKNYAVWRFGFTEGSPLAESSGVCLTRAEDGNMAFIWVLATRRSGKVKEVVRDWALNLPDSFKRVIEAPVVITCHEGYLASPKFHAPTNTIIKRRV